MKRSIAARTPWTVILFSVLGCTPGDSNFPTAPPRFAQLQSSAPVQEPLFGYWHRIAAGGDAAHSEHSVWNFVIQRNTWDGRYDKRPEPGLGFPSPPLGDFGTFQGVEATNFVCQPTFPFYPCQDVVAVVEGTVHYQFRDQWDFEVLEQEIIVRDASGHEMLWEYWVQPGNFVCPWYRSFDEALAANPSFHQDCIFPVAGD